MRHKTKDDYTERDRTYVVEWVGGGVDALAEEPIDPEGELVAALLRKHFPLQDEGDDPRAVGRREKVRRLRRKSVKIRKGNESSSHLIIFYLDRIEQMYSLYIQYIFYLTRSMYFDYTSIDRPSASKSWYERMCACNLRKIFDFVHASSPARATRVLCTLTACLVKPCYVPGH